MNTYSVGRKIMINEDEFSTWLLNANTPSIRYQTMADLLGYPANEPHLIQARQEIMTTGAVPAILSHQSEIGSWIGERSYYTPKYNSSHWSMLLLAEYNTDGDDPRFQQGVQHMLDATAADLSSRFETNTPGFACFWGNLLRYALHAGLAQDARVQNIIHYVARDLQVGPCRCLHNTDVPCAWGVVRGLWGLAAIPKARRTPEITQAIAEGVEFLLASFHLIDANYPTPDNAPINPIWFKLNFPLFYQVDILFTLRVLDELNRLDHPGARAALDWLEQRRLRNGRWPGSSPYRRRTWRELGDREETERWISLQASRILLHAGRLSYY
jgi:hypothetical protein